MCQKIWIFISAALKASSLTRTFKFWQNSQSVCLMQQSTGFLIPSYRNISLSALIHNLLPFLWDEVLSWLCQVFVLDTPIGLLFNLPHVVVYGRPHCSLAVPQIIQTSSFPLSYRHFFVTNCHSLVKVRKSCQRQQQNIKKNRCRFPLQCLKGSAKITAWSELILIRLKIQFVPHSETNSAWIINPGNFMLYVGIIPVWCWSYETGKCAVWSECRFVDY